MRGQPEVGRRPLPELAEDREKSFTEVANELKQQAEESGRTYGRELAATRQKHAA